MALHWNLNDIKEVKDGKIPEDLRRLAEALIWATCYVSMPSITEANAEEFWARCRTWCAIKDGWMIYESDGTGRPPTLEEVKRCIGLATNAKRQGWKPWLEELVQGEIRTWKTLEKCRPLFKEASND